MALGIQLDKLRGVFGIVFSQGAAAQVSTLGPLGQFALAEGSCYRLHLRRSKLTEHLQPLFFGDSGIASGGVRAAQHHTQGGIFGVQLDGFFDKLLRILVLLQGL